MAKDIFLFSHKLRSTTLGYILFDPTRSFLFFFKDTTHDGLILTSHVGCLEVSLAYYAKAGTLKVLIIKCHDLPATNEEGSANPYVKA